MEASIWVVDDMADMVLLLELALKRLGYKTNSARTGQDLLQKLTATSTMPDLIVCDLLMPDGDGFQVLDAMAENPAWRNIPLVIMSANLTSDRLERLKTYRVAGYLPKPFTVATFYEVLQQALDTAE